MLFLFSLTYPGLSFFEPANKHDTDYNLSINVYYYETSLVYVFIFDLMIDSIHRFSDYDRSFNEKYLFNFKFLNKFLIILMLYIDYLYFWNSFPKTALRFARYFRPCNII